MTKKLFRLRKRYHKHKNPFVIDKRMKKELKKEGVEVYKDDEGIYDVDSGSYMVP